MIEQIKRDFIKQVNKALENGLDPVKEHHDKRYSVDGFRIFQQQEDTYTIFDDITFWSKTRSGRVTINLCAFIVSPEIGFLDKLVGIVDDICVNLTCNYHEKGYEGNCAGWADGESAFAAGCKKAEIIPEPTAAHHRSKLANMTLTDMIEYISNL